MKKAVQQEILLMTGSSLSKGNLCERNSPDANRFSRVERLEEACWNGMLEDLLPGVLVKVEGKTLFLWKIQNANNFLHIDLCDKPEYKNGAFSIDPYVFLKQTNPN